MQYRCCSRCCAHRALCVLARVVGSEAGSKVAQGALVRSLSSQMECDRLVGGTSIVCGEVAHCVKKLTDLGRESGFDNPVCWTRIGGLANAKALAAMELRGGEMLPAAHKGTARKAA